jgi:20S proteasome alpha/beta subunit
MTCIAWDGKTLAADKRATGGTLTRVTKIFRTKDGRLMGASGDGSYARELMAWAEAGEVPAAWPASADKSEAELMVIGLDGEIRIYYHRPFALKPEDGRFAMGSGGAYAMTAMHLGYGAARAVEVASELTDSCGDGVDTLALEVAS